MDEYLILFPIPNPYRRELCRLMDQISYQTEIPPPYQKLMPHITFHRPLTGVGGPALKNIIASTALRMKQTRITLSSLFPFGKHYIVLPVQATRSVAALWVGINDLVSRLPEYEHGTYDDDNTLHVTVAAKTSDVFDEAWPEIEKMRVKPMMIPLQTIALYLKSEAEGKWKEVEKFHIP